jgi:maltose alpha-D-glucosyltransferase/alpha-amylase
MDPVYGFSAVNVEAQSRSLSSLLSWMKRLISVRKSTKVFGRGTLTFIRPHNRAVLAYVRALGSEAILCVCNLSRAAQAVELDLSAWKGRIPREMLGRTRFPRIGDLPYLVTLPPYGFFWFALGEEAEAVPEKVLPREITTLVLGPGWESLLSGWTKRTLELDVLPNFIPDRRWFGDKASRAITATVSAAIPIEHRDDRFLATIAEIKGAHGASRYFLPMTIRWTRYTAIDRGPASLLAAVRRGAREGTLLDAAAEPEFASALLGKIHAGDSAGAGAHRIEFCPQPAFSAAPAPQIEKVEVIGGEQSNSSVVVDNKYVIKILRRVTSGLHPDIEIGRFLAGTHFKNAPALLGSVELVEDESRAALAVVHAYVENQGVAWSIAAASLDRLVEQQRLVPAETLTETSETGSMLQRMRQVGRRTAELHLAFAAAQDDDAFPPEPIAPDDAAHWSETAAARAEAVFALLERQMRILPEATARLAQQLLTRRSAILAHIAAGKDVRYDGLKIRQHGDFHLGQVLIAKDDAFILDFEGEPRRSLEERRRKMPPARDVAGFIRSIDYAASAAVERAPDLKPEEREALAGHLRVWGERLVAAFWESYAETLGNAPLWPSDKTQSQQLLETFALDKAFYEIEYELTNRPSWAYIPLDAAIRILHQRGVD